jgi:hypothetical protein
MENEETVALVKTELKFLFDLLLYLRDRSEQPKIGKEKLTGIAKLLLEHINSIIKNQNTAAKVVL